MNKKFIISVSAIAVLLLYILIANMKNSSDIPTLPRWDVKSDEIIITRPSGTIKLYVKEGKWVINDEAFPADEKAVADVEKQFKDIRLSDLISKKGFYNKYDLTPDRYSEIIFKKGEAVFRKFKLGKKSSTGRHTFVRVDDRPEIYLAEGTFDQVLNKTLDDYRDKNVVSIKKDSVSEVTIEYLGSRLALVREKKGGAGRDKTAAKKSAAEKWVITGQETVPVDAVKVDAILAGLDPLRAASFLEIQKETLSQRVCGIQIKAGKKEIAVAIYKKDNKFIATSSENQFVYVLDNWAAERFFIAGADKLKSAGK